MILVENLVLVTLGLAAVVGVLKILRAGTLGDRAVAFDMLTAVITCALLVSVGRSRDGLQLDLAVVLGLLGFVAAVTIARFLETERSDES